MLVFKATYKLSNNNGKTTYTSQPFKTKEEAKQHLLEELDLLAYDGKLEHITYCNVINESIIDNTHERDNMVTDVLNHLFTPSYNKETGEVEEKKPKKFNLKKINKKMKKLELKKRKIEAEIEAVKDLIMPPKRGQGKDKSNASPQEELKQALEAHGLSVYLGNIVEPRKAHRTNHKAPSDNEVLVQKIQQKFYDYQNSELKEVLNPYGKKKLNKS